VHPALDVGAGLGDRIAAVTTNALSFARKMTPSRSIRVALPSNPIQRASSVASKRPQSVA
jgi:hypothetical protein